ncbi:MAG TPA: hypothetical protein VFN55_09195 [Solirubrobacteraceae bacterium]|nr:hypothetical protein [Solirubrobacteraceae bacterium]
MRRALIVTLTTGAMLAGCGQNSTLTGPGSDASANRAARRLLGPGLQVVPTPAPTHRPPGGDAVHVIRAWATALRTGQLTAAAGWFANPSEFVNGVGTAGALGAVRINSLRTAIAANETLPCGAKFVSADQRGRYVNALFRLTGRSGPGGDATCGGSAGQTARTNFLIADGRIVEWIRAPDDPGDNGGSGGSGGGGVNPGGPRQGPGTATGPTV